MRTVTARPSETGERGLRGWHVLLAFLAFFGVMFCVNGIFLYHAITSFPGEDVKKSYVQGLDYNQTLEARRVQRDLGWYASAGLREDSIVFEIRNRDGRVLYGHTVEAHIRHAADTSLDQRIPLIRSASGQYSADVSSLRAGKWHVQFDVRSHDGGEILFQAHKEISVSP